MRLTLVASLLLAFVAFVVGGSVPAGCAGEQCTVEIDMSGLRNDCVVDSECEIVATVAAPCGAGFSQLVGIRRDQNDAYQARASAARTELNCHKNLACAITGTPAIVVCAQRACAVEVGDGGSR